MKVTTGYPIFISNDKDTKKDVSKAIEKAADDFYEAEGELDSSVAGQEEFFDADGEDHSEFLDGIKAWNQRRKEKKEAKKADKAGVAPTSATAPAGATPAEKKKFDLDKTLGQAKAGADLFGTVKGLFGKGGAPAGAPEVVGGGGVPYVAPDEKKGMSTGAKIGIAVGAIAVVGIIIYAATRDKGASKGK